MTKNSKTPFLAPLLRHCCTRPKNNQKHLKNKVKPMSQLACDIAATLATSTNQSGVRT